MEKIKPYLEQLKKHHFWVLTGICAVVVLYCWNSATQEIEKQFSANKTKVEGEFSKIQKLSGLQEYPNRKWEEGVVQKGQEVAKQIEATAKGIAKRQQRALAWEEFSEAFRDEVRKRSPQDWPDGAIAEFQHRMPEEVKRLRTIVHAADTADQEGVQWNDEDYQNTMSAFTMEELPPKKLVMKMRTRFWVFESLAKIVAATNEGAEDKFNLPIHDLEVMAVGPDSRANAQPEDWQVAGIADAGAAAVPALTGYDIWAVRLKVRMDLKYLNRLLTACANSDLPLDVTGVRFDHPNRAPVVKQEEEPDRGTGYRGGFGGFAPMGMEKEEEKVEEEPEPKPAVPSRGTLVEITGFVYIANEKSLQQGLPKPDKAAAVVRPATPPPTFAHSTAVPLRPRDRRVARERSS